MPLGELGHKGGRDGDDEEAVGEGEDGEGVVEFRQRAVAAGEAGRQELKPYGGRHEHHHRAGEPRGREQGRVPDLRARPVAEGQQRGHQGKRHHRDADRHAEGKHVEGQALVAPLQDGVSDKGTYDDQVIQDGREGGQKEAPVCLEHPGRHGGHAVEEHLHGEDAEKEHRKVRGLFGPRGWDVPGTAPVTDERYQGPGKDDAKEGKKRHQRQHQGKQGVGQAAGVVLAVAGDTVHQDGYEDRIQNPAQKKLVDQARQEHGQGVSIRHHERAEHRGLHRDTHVARRPREHRGRRDGDHRP